jgi:hypothetical protein
LSAFPLRIRPPPFAFPSLSPRAVPRTLELRNCHCFVELRHRAEYLPDQLRGWAVIKERGRAIGCNESIEVRPGFTALLTRIAANGARTIIVETANRFARDLMVQEVGFAMLRVPERPALLFEFERRRGLSGAKLAPYVAGPLNPYEAPSLVARGSPQAGFKALTEPHSLMAREEGLKELLDVLPKLWVARVLCYLYQHVFDHFPEPFSG